MRYKQIEYNFNDSNDSMINYIHLVKWHEDEGWVLDEINGNLITFKKENEKV